jgi:formate-dependent nitrite reductase membrane component NrfD
LLLIGFEMLAIFLFLMFAHLTVGDVKHAVSVILFGGSLATMFWVGVVLIGLLFPALVELYYVVPKLIYHREFAAPRAVEVLVPVAVLIGGFMLRYVVVIAGQITGPVGI